MSLTVTKCGGAVRFCGTGVIVYRILVSAKAVSIRVIAVSGLWLFDFLYSSDCVMIASIMDVRC